MTVIDSPEGLSAFGWLQVIHGLGLEINTGMKLSRGGNLMKLCAAKGYTGPVRGTVDNKRKALEWAIGKLREIDPAYQYGTVIARALGQEG